MFEISKGLRVLITGASGGIGQEIAKTFGNFGASVGVHYNHNKKDALEVVKDIISSGGLASAFAKDLLDVSDLSNLIQDFVNEYKGIDVLINNAGANIGNYHFLEIDPQFLTDTINLNYIAPFLLSREAFKFMKDSGGGRIINISSISAKFGGSLQSMHYAAAKSALESLTISLSKAGAEHNILVNTIRPGIIDTSFHNKAPKNNMEERIDLIPLKKMGTPEDIAQMVLFLTSSASNYITGQVFSVSGGE